MRELVRDFVKKNLKKSLPKKSVTKVVWVAFLLGFAALLAIIFVTSRAIFLPKAR